MRCDKKIYLCKNGESVYDEITGDYTESPPIKTLKYANVNDMSDEKATMLLGKITANALTVRLNGLIDDETDYILIDNNKYIIKQSRKEKNKHTFQVVKL